jgi:hypothetical protein
MLAAVDHTLVVVAAAAVDHMEQEVVAVHRQQLVVAAAAYRIHQQPAVPNCFLVEILRSPKHHHRVLVVLPLEFA